MRIVSVIVQNIPSYSIHHGPRPRQPASASGANDAIGVACTPNIHHRYLFMANWEIRREQFNSHRCVSVEREIPLEISSFYTQSSVVLYSDVLSSSISTLGCKPSLGGSHPLGPPVSLLSAVGRRVPVGGKNVGAEMSEPVLRSGTRSSGLGPPLWFHDGFGED